MCSLLLAGLALNPAMAREDVVTIEGTRIQGEQEMPGLVFDIPWRDASFASLDRQEERLLTRRTVEPLERPGVQRLLELHRQYRELVSGESGD